MEALQDLADLIALSIPAWFDWRPHGRRRLGGGHGAFNPSLVRLARAVEVVLPPPLLAFQSQLGSIGAAVW